MSKAAFAPDNCAICGAAIPPKARACPECGADEQTGWREQSMYDGLDLPEADTGPKRERTGSAIFWKVTGLVLLVIMIVLVLRSRW